MPKYIIHDGQTYMIVSPAKPLLNSKMMKDVIKTERRFAVNMNTGMLTILPKEEDPNPKMIEVRCPACARRWNTEKKDDFCPECGAWVRTKI